MKKIIIGLSLIAISFSAYAQEFTTFSRDNTIKVKSLGANGTGTVIGYEDDFVYILTAAHIAEGEGVTVSIKENRYTATKENRPEYSLINTSPFVKDNTLDLAVIKIHKAFLPTTNIKSGDHGFGFMNMSTDTVGITKKELGLTGFAGLSEEPSSITEKITAHNFNKDSKYFELEGAGNGEGYAGALIGTQNTVVAILLSDNNDANAKAAKTETIINFLKKNGVPHNLIRLGKMK
jgi:hypothetical protein